MKVKFSGAVCELPADFRGSSTSVGSRFRLQFPARHPVKPVHRLRSGAETWPGELPGAVAMVPLCRFSLTVVTAVWTAQSLQSSGISSSPGPGPECRRCADGARYRGLKSLRTRCSLWWPTVRNLHLTGWIPSCGGRMFPREFPAFNCGQPAAGLTENRVFPARLGRFVPGRRRRCLRR